MHFGISEGMGGLKHGSRPWLGMDIFWNCPLQISSIFLYYNYLPCINHCPEHLAMTIISKGQLYM